MSVADLASPAVPLIAAPRNHRVVVATVDWDQLSGSEIRRLREFGLDEGVEVELLHGTAFGGGPVAARIGRMAVTFRAHVARAIHVTPTA